MDAQQWSQRYVGDGLVWSGQVNRFVAQYLADRPAGSALDLGAGEGRNAVWLARRGWRVTAVDYSPVGLAKADALAAAAEVEVATVVADVADFEPEGPVDLVLICYLQVPDADQAHLLGRVSQWLHPDGSVLVVAHDKSNVTDGWGGPGDPRVCYDAAATAAALAPMLIEVSEVRSRDVPGGPRPALDTVVLARAAG